MISKNVKDRFYDAFRGISKPTTKIAVIVENDDSDPVLINEIQNLNEFNEINSVAISATVDVISYTVPVGKTLNLSVIEVSGCSLGEFNIFISTINKARKRTTHGNYNLIFPFNGLALSCGTLIKIQVTNSSKSIAKYESRILGNLL